MKKNIWMFNHYATGMFFNKGGRHYWFAENLIKQNYNPTIFCANTRHNGADSIIIDKRKYKANSVNNISFVFVKTTEYKGNGFSRVKNMLMFYKNLFSVSKQYAKDNRKPDLILASSVHPLTLVAGIKIAKRFGIPCVCEVRDLWPEAIFAFNKAKKKSMLGRILVAGEHWIYKNAAAIVFTKEGDTDYIIEKKWDKHQGGDIDLSKTYYINNGVDLESYEKSIKENILIDSDLEIKKFNVVYTGAIRPVNNVANLLDTAKLLKDNKDIQFLIYGDGNQLESLQKRVVDEGITNLKMKGFVNKKYIPYILSKSSVNILNYSKTRYNWSRGNSSNKLFEYMAAGKPIISTVRMGYSIIDKYKCGIELENSTPIELAKAIMDIKNMKKEEYNILGKNAKQGVEDFDFKILTKRLIKVINDVKKEE